MTSLTAGLAPPKPKSYDAATVGVLWRRDVMRFLRQPSRIIGALGQPILVWLLIGSGMASSFRMPGSEVGYLEFFYPGVVMMVLLFASIFSTVSVIEDRHQGFLQAVMAGPGSRAALVIGKCAGSATVALMQAALLLCLAPMAGFSLLSISWPLLIATLAITSLGLTALGVAVAWWLDNLQAFHAIQMTVLVPLWLVSGAMFPAGSNPVFAAIMRLNPMAYAVSAARHAFYGGHAVAGITPFGPLVDLSVVGACSCVCLVLGVVACTRRS
jgi:daunorubicin resistance ABC transporter membrane protein